MLIVPPTLPRVARDDSGFTLIETLVAIVTGVIVTGALFAILEVALHQSARVVDVVQATQLSRTTMTRMVNELHSACIAPKFTPIEKGSTENELIFINGYSKESQIPLSSASATEGQLGAYLHKIKYESSKLVDYTYPSTGGVWPNFTFSGTASPAKGVRIGENISQSETPAKLPVPVFQYFKYATESSGGAETPLGTISTTAQPGAKAGLSEAEAAQTASVLISYRTASANKDTRQNRSVDLSSQVTLAFSAPNSEATITAGPCE